MSPTQYGAELDQSVINKLKNCPDPTDIFDHLNDFNSEIIDTYQKDTIETVQKHLDESALTVELARKKLGIQTKPLSIVTKKINQPTNKRDLAGKNRKPIKPVARKQIGEVKMSSETETKIEQTSLEDALNELTERSNPEEKVSTVTV